MINRPSTTSKKNRQNWLHRYVFHFMSIAVILFVIRVFYSYYLRIGAFGCFDDCHTITSAYFMTKGRMLYSEIFYNHQMLMPYSSFVIQKILQPQTLYQLILSHRLFMMGTALLLDIMILLRFRWGGAAFILLYEPTKFYFLGDRFLPEALIAYLSAYLFGLLLLKWHGNTLTRLDQLVGAIFCWFIIFSREPYIPLGILFFLFLFGVRSKIPFRIEPAVVFLIFSAVTLLSVPIPDYLFTVGTVNATTVLKGEVSSNNLAGAGFISIFLYPLIIFWQGKWTFIRYILIGISSVFLIVTGTLLRDRKFGMAVGILLLLASAAIRVVPPGMMFYEAFHLLPWYAMFISFVCLFIFRYLQQRSRRVMGIAGGVILLLVTSYAVFSPSSFLHESIDSAQEFHVGYAQYSLFGEAIKTLSTPSDKLFLEQWDDVIYWVAGLDSSYQYGLFTPIIASTQRYTDARERMFMQNPPDFYYCPPHFSSNNIPAQNVASYVQLAMNDKPTCLFIQRKKLETITHTQWNDAKRLGFTVFTPPEVPDPVR
ncbi:hypothetical protein HY468_04650 [Candidatus Roizmanbacteria bacterium]|nr:hypothetical protein [Candidatus Roizmanbacteria bacterium]